MAGPDFPSFPNGLAEKEHIGRAKLEDVEQSGGRSALQGFGLENFDEESGHTRGAKITIKKANDLLFY